MREAAEATKIRGDFLGYIETGKMEFDLPEIYKRGFLKNYARFLKLDVDKIMTDYTAQQLSNSRLGKKSGSEWFGQMEIKKAEHEEPAVRSPRTEAEEPAPYGRIAAKPAPERASEDEESHEEEEETDKTFYMKIGLIFVGTLALVFVVFGLIWAILGGDSSNEITDEPQLRDSAEISQAAGDDIPAAESPSDLTLFANGSSVYVTVRQKIDRKPLYSGAVEVGSPVALEKTGPVEIGFTSGEHLEIESGGERFAPSAGGAAKITIQ